MDPNAFDEVLGLEEQFYSEGFQQGYTDGVKGGQVEGRTFGLEKGFEKYVESGRLYGKSLVWANRMPGSSKISVNYNLQQLESASDTDVCRKCSRMKLPPLPQNQRLAKHLKVLHALSESESLSTENTEEAVSDFDDRLRRAQGKAKIVEKMAGEVGGEVIDSGQMGNENPKGNGDATSAITMK
jgi:hypothetical protein